MKRLILAALFAYPILAQQQGTPVTVTPYPRDSPTEVFNYDGSGNLIAICYTKGAAPNGTTSNYNFSYTIAASTLTSIAVSSNVGTVTTPSAHGLLVNEKVIVTGSATTALNGTYVIQTVPSPTTFTITTSGVGNATYTDTNLKVAGQAPLTTAPIWSVQRNNYNGSSQLTSTQCANGNTGADVSVCANYATLSYQ